MVRSSICTTAFYLISHDRLVENVAQLPDFRVQVSGSYPGIILHQIVESAFVAPFGGYAHPLDNLLRLLAVLCSNPRVRCFAFSVPG